MRDAEELHDWLLTAVLVPAEGVPPHLLAELVATGRAARLTVSTPDGSQAAVNEVFGTSRREFIVCAERVLHATRPVSGRGPDTGPRSAGRGFPG